MPTELCECGNNGDRCEFCHAPMCCWVPVDKNCDTRWHCETCRHECTRCVAEARSRVRRLT